MESLLLPPEITSTLMYTGPGSPPLTAAASAWSSLAAELKSSAGICQAVIGQLTSEEWLGTASASMAAAVTPYLNWMLATAEQAEQAAAQARSAAAAYETAHSLTVPPVAVTTNRVQLQQLVSTNILGQNTGAIASNEMQHNEMWAQNVVAGHGYQAQAAAATTFQSFTSPPNPTDPSGQAAQGGAVAQAGATTASGHAATASNAMQNLVTSASSQSAVPTNPAQDVLNDPGYQLSNQLMTQLTNQSNLQSNNLCALWRGLSGVTGTQRLMMDMSKDAAKAASGGAASAAAGGAASAAAGAAAGAGGAASAAAGAAGGLGAVTGGMGSAGALGGLSVPPSWAPPAPPVTPLGPVSGGSWQPVGPGILGQTPMAPPPGMPGVPGAAAAHGAGFRGFSAPRYGVQPTVMPKVTVGG